MLKYLTEIKSRLTLLIFTLCSIIAICYTYKEILLFMVTQIHLNDTSSYFIFTNVTELFSVYFRLIMFISIQISVWYLFYHIFTFLSPALFFYEYEFGSFFFRVSTFFWFFSIFLSIFILIPFGWNFFLSFQTNLSFYFEANLTQYLDFCVSVYLLSFVYCQSFTLLFFFLLNVAQNCKYIKRFRKIYYYIFVLFATLVSPPDIFTQIVISFFTTIFFEFVIFIFLLRFFTRLP